MNEILVLMLRLAFEYIQKEQTMEISQIEPRIEDTQDEYEKAQKFKKYVQGIFIENNSQEEFKRRVDAIFNETFKGERK